MDEFDDVEDLTEDPDTEVLEDEIDEDEEIEEPEEPMAGSPDESVSTYVKIGVGAAIVYFIVRSLNKK